MKTVIADIIVIIGLSRTNNLKDAKNTVYIMENKNDLRKSRFLNLFAPEKTNNPLAKYLNISTNTRVKI